MEVQGGTQQTLYGLNVEEEYEVHIRSRMKAFTKFGGYSDSIFIQLANYPGRGEMSATHDVHNHPLLTNREQGDREGEGERGAR